MLLAFLFLLLLGLEAVLTYTTDGANPIIGDILKCCSWSDSAIGIAFCWIVNVSANFTNVLHNRFCLLVINKGYYSLNNPLWRNVL